MHDLFRLSPHIQILPIIHGSGDFAVEVRRILLANQFDCLAVPLPPSFQEDVERAIEYFEQALAIDYDLDSLSQGTSKNTYAAPRDFSKHEKLLFFLRDRILVRIRQHHQ